MIDAPEMNQQMNIPEVPITGIWLMAESRNEHDPLAQVVVYVEMNGQWYEAIRELAGNNFSHCISGHGLFGLKEPAKWSVTPDLGASP